MPYLVWQQAADVQYFLSWGQFHETAEIGLAFYDRSFKLVIMNAISATEFKAKCLHLLDEVQRTGQDLVICKRGKPVARVVTAKPERPWLALRGKGRFVGDPIEPVVDNSEIEALRK